MLFGWGDGGGGPTKRMLEVVRRAKDLQGLPRTQMRTSDDFFTRLEKDITDRPVMIGELYFECHRGTYTTQGAVKRGNRKNEWLLHDIEFLATVASQTGKTYRYPQNEIERLWKIVLLNQFHDILPGSSITLVYEDAERHHAEVAQAGSALREKAAAALTGRGTAVAPINTIGFPRREVAQSNGKLLFIDAPSYGIGKVTEARDRVIVKESRKGWTVENAQLRAEVSKNGTVTSLVEKTSGRQTFAAPGNRLRIYDDRPTAWDAWDVDPFHLETAKDCPPADSAKVTCRDPLRAEITFKRQIGARAALPRLSASTPNPAESSSTRLWTGTKSTRCSRPPFP